MKVHAGKRPQAVPGNDILSFFYAQRKLEKECKRPAWKLARAVAGNPFVLIGKPQK
jgi:hypothetical protein